VCILLRNIKEEEMAFIIVGTSISVLVLMMVGVYYDGSDSWQGVEFGLGCGIGLIIFGILSIILKL
jgi:hypothetical protein